MQKITANLAAAGKAINYDYEYNRLTGIRYPDNSGNNVTYTYGDASLHNDFNQIGRIVRVSYGAGGAKDAIRDATRH